MTARALIPLACLLAAPAMTQDIPEAPLLELAGHTGQIHDVDVSPDGSRILTASEDHTVRLWDAQSGEQLGVYEHPEELVKVLFSSTERQFVSKSVIGTPVSSTEVRTWDSLSGELLQTVTVPRNAHILDDQWTVSFETMGAGSTPQVPQDRMYIHDNKTGEVQRINHPNEPSWSFVGSVSMEDAVSLRDSHLAVFVFRTATYAGHTAFNRYTELWDTRDWVPIRRDARVASAFSSDGRYYAGLSYADDFLYPTYVRETRSGRLLHDCGLTNVFPYAPTAATVSPNGRVALTTLSVSIGGIGPYLRISFCILWDPETGETLWDTGATEDLWNHEASAPWRSFVLIDKKVHDVSFFPDGKRFISVGTDGVGRIWDISDLVQSTVGKEAGEY